MLLFATALTLAVLLPHGATIPAESSFMTEIASIASLIESATVGELISDRPLIVEEENTAMLQQPQLDATATMAANCRASGCSAEHGASIIGGHDVGQTHIVGGDASRCCTSCASTVLCHAALWIPEHEVCYFKGADFMRGYVQHAEETTQWLVVPCGGNGCDGIITAADSADATRCAPTTVADLGCWADSWPNAFQRISDDFFWQARSPEVCACMCKLKDPEHFTGLVSFGSDGGSPGHCNCQFNRQLSYKVRGALPDTCCQIYDETTKTIVRRTPFVSPDRAPCGLQARVKRPYPAPYEAQLRHRLHGGKDEKYTWRMRVFNVTMCDLKCNSAENRGGKCGRVYTSPSDDEWEKYEQCPVVVGRGLKERCQPSTALDVPDEGGDEEGGTMPSHGMPTTVRVGGRIPGVGDTFVEATFPADAYKSNVCDGREIFRVLHQAHLTAHHGAAAVGEEEIKARTTLHYALHKHDLPKGTTAIEAAGMVKNSTDWLCANSAMLHLSTVSCWTKRGGATDAARDGHFPGRGTTRPLGEDDCIPEMERSGSVFEKPRELCGALAGAKHTTKEESLFFVRSLTQDLKTDIYDNMRHTCPDLHELSECLYPLLNRHAYPWGEREGGAPKYGAVAIIIPYRRRPTELRKWAWWMLPILLREQMNPFSGNGFGVFVAEEKMGPIWNKGRLNNAAVLEIRKLSSSFDCFIFADVDLILQAPSSILDNGNCRLRCEEEFPVHFSTMLRGYDGHYNHVAQGVFCDSSDCHAPAFRGGQSSGGVVGASADQLTAFDGWPNHCWGWGNEDGLFDGRIKNRFGRMKAPVEWTVETGNHECVWIHLTDKESAVKGQKVDRSGFGDRSQNRYTRGGLRELADPTRSGGPLYSLDGVEVVGGRDGGSPLLTVLKFNLFDD